MEGRVNGVNEMWDEMTKDKLAKEQDLEKLHDGVAEYEKRATAVEEKITKTKKALPIEAAPVLDLPQMRTNLADVKAIDEQVTGIKPQVDSTVAFGKALIEQDPEVDGSNVTRRNEELEELLKGVDESVKEEVGRVQDLVDQMEQYGKSVKELRKDLAYVHDEVEGNKPGHLDPESWKEKVASVKVSSLMM